MNAWTGNQKFTVQRLKDSIEATEKRIETLGRQMSKAKTEKRAASCKFKQVGKKQRLDVLRGKLRVAEAELAAGKPKICFGGRKDLRDGDVWKWRSKRVSRIFLVGAKDDDRFGNQSVHWDGSSIRLRMPDSLGGGFKTLTGVNFRYGQTEMLRLMERALDEKNRVAATWLLFMDDDGRWHAHVTVDEPAPEVTTDMRHGVVAVDVNVGFLAVTIVDHWGNPTGRATLPFPPSGVPEGETAVIIGDSVRAICMRAKSLGYGVACEDLEFSKKKAGLREFGAAHALRLSGWAYAKFFAMLEARCAREGIDFHQVNPAYTSVIGRMKYARGRAMSAHHAAALVIGRRAQGHDERFVAMDGSILDGPARNRPRSEWRRWRGTRRLAREGAKAPVITARYGAGTTSAGGLRRSAPHAVSSTGRRRTVDAIPQARGAVALAQPRSH